MAFFFLGQTLAFLFGPSQYQGQNKGFMPSSERPLTQMSPRKEHLNGKGSE
jgi:hypothetical protein